MLKELLDKLLPADTPSEVRKKMMEFGRKNPDMSELQIVAQFKPSMKRAKRKEAEKATKRGKETAAAKRKMTKAEGKTKMMRGGMANKKEHFYVGGGAVTDNAGLRALKASGPKGMEAYNKITGK